MSLIDFILNIAGLLLWLNWRVATLPFPRHLGTPLLSTIRPAGPPRARYGHWLALPGLLAGRAIFYWQVGPPVHWNPEVTLGPTSLSFRSDMAGRMFLFSTLSFGVTLGICYLWLLVLSCVNARANDGDPIQRLVRAWLGRMDRWPAPVKLLLPLAVTVAGWWALHPVLAKFNLVPANAVGQLCGQGLVIGLSAYLTLKYLLAALLLLYVLTSYVYLGEFALWPFVNYTVRRLLGPLQNVPLRLGKLDLTPILSIIVILVLAEFARRGLALWYHHLS